MISTGFVAKVGEKYLAHDKHSGYPYLEDDSALAYVADSADDLEATVARYIQDGTVKFRSYELCIRTDVVMHTVTL